MSYVIKWTTQAEIAVAQNMDYLVREWNDKVLHRFLNDVETALQKIKQDPLLYPLQTRTENVRKYKINKRINLYYKVVDEATIELITFWNNYRNPEQLKF